MATKEQWDRYVARKQQLGMSFICAFDPVDDLKLLDDAMKKHPGLSPEAVAEVEDREVAEQVKEHEDVGTI